MIFNSYVQEIAGDYSKITGEVLKDFDDKEINTKDYVHLFGALLHCDSYSL